MADNKTSAEKPPFYIRHFFLILVILGLLGGFLALTVPSWRSWAEIPCIGFIGSFLQSFIPPSDAEKYPEGKVIADLRQHILYITGGIIAILTLLQTNWKNQVDRRKVKDDIQKNKNDHNRQVHAERRSRYTKAVEQLGDEKATVRLGGIYTLVGLVDEWLSDDTLDSEEQHKEGQAIINNLCSYIRSPFLVLEKIEEYKAYKVFKNFGTKENAKFREAEYLQVLDIFERFIDSDEYEEPKDITTDYAKFHEEQDVRRTIFVEMSKRSSIVKPAGYGEVSVTPRTWSSFNFDFSRAPIFYPLSKLTIEEANFTSARFYDESSFSEAIFTKTATFRGATFTKTADFWSATFAETANFSLAKFAHTANFSWAKFAHTANFSWATFTETADFRGATFAKTADFSQAEFTKTADFWSATFAETANFSQAEFTKTATLRAATFTETADFRGAIFKGIANFDDSTFNRIACFSGAIFKGIACFGEATFEKYSPLFVTTSDESGKTYRALFAVLSDNQGEHKFTVVREGSKLIEPGKATLRGKPYTIPVGTVLFDWDDEIQGFITSEPAEPLDESDKIEEDISK